LPGSLVLVDETIVRHCRLPIADCRFLVARLVHRMLEPDVKLTAKW
jgi:hypothetical protein